ncbi:GNAT family N-acetyltransferase [Exiguobacterium alkaliphilum]|uniref:GNAT family N-acetyltransferase n=1 Tax=Exiguobacterium alkaliphilum TaxID=1428684 RepID=A0ABT2KUP2_9BACL|nr:GNAT family N-acetyltransferase [Exiguobacterium alkaliphilum]MCT4794243.1 GNAT family N-acetyltransferase [Exiguobacterium alkaliphilum]QUE86209.1 GNAT family N-acetyltransferase [Exiguobacterium alkaliphilum]
MNIRQAKPADATNVAPLVYAAIHDIAYSLTGTKQKEQVLERLAMWIGRPANRLSYENIWVAESEGTIAGIIIAYAGMDARKLDEPIRQWLMEAGETGELDVETEGDVFYIDSVAVDSQFGGRGIGTKLINSVTQHARSKHIPVVTLNVDQTNPAAARLYERLGFYKQKEIEISGGRFDYMVLDL